jgi:multidrug efflux pump subunit AcrB
VFQRPGSNALSTALMIRATMEGLSKSFPPGLAHTIIYDPTQFIAQSVEEVEKSIGEAILLVVLVVVLFLQTWRAAVIPLVAIPISLIGTFFFMGIFGFTLNNLTLFGLVLAVGIVVDDAIVVVENVERIMREEHKPAHEAAIQAMREVTGPVIAIALTLCAVFVPIAFLGGLTGELYRQFSVTISIAVVISAIVALTLTPTLSALMLERGHRPPGRFFRWFNKWFGRVTTRYADGVGFVLRRGSIAMLLFAGMVALTLFLWRITPGSLVPDEDQGYYIGAVFLPDGATLQRTDKVVTQVQEAMLSNPANQFSVAFTGMDFLGGGFRSRDHRRQSLGRALRLEAVMVAAAEGDNHHETFAVLCVRPHVLCDFPGHVPRCHRIRRRLRSPGPSRRAARGLAIYCPRHRLCAPDALCGPAQHNGPPVF